MPAFVAYAAADALVLPVDAQITALAPCPAATEIAVVIPRSLNEPVGLSPSNLSQTSAPTREERCSAGINGVPPSRSVTTGIPSREGKPLGVLADHPAPLVRHVRTPRRA